MNLMFQQDPLFIFLIVIGLSLLPFVAMMVTSFTKLVVVFSLIRNALGIQQIPPNMVINGLALVISIYIMSPVMNEMFQILKNEEFTKRNFKEIIEITGKAKEPMRDFLMKHSKEKERNFFTKSAKIIWRNGQTLNSDDFLVVVPAFTVSELTSAFEIGFLLYLPFIIIDLVISNILLAMGMMMVSPMTISLPFKLLLFVLVEGWSKVIHGLIFTYG